MVAFILGIVEGLTEFIPVSSTGHLIIFARIFGFTGPKAEAFEVIIQFGAILAAVVVYFDRLVQLIPVGHKASKTHEFRGWHGIWLLLLTTLPSVVVGLVFHDFIKEYLFNTTTVAIGLIVGGIALIAVNRYKKPPTTNSIDRLSVKQAFGIGLFQITSLFPGTSRAASTIIGGQLMGLDRQTTVQYSFLAAIPIITGAGLLDLYKSYHLFGPNDYINIAIGLVTSFVVGLLAIRFLINFANKHSLAVFGWYRLVVGAIVLAYL